MSELNLMCHFIVLKYHFRCLNSFRPVATKTTTACILVCFLFVFFLCKYMYVVNEAGNDVMFLQRHTVCEQATNHRKFPTIIWMCSVSFFLTHASNSFAVAITLDCPVWWWMWLWMAKCEKHSNDYRLQSDWICKLQKLLILSKILCCFVYFLLFF